MSAKIDPKELLFTLQDMINAQRTTIEEIRKSLKLLLKDLDIAEGRVVKIAQKLSQPQNLGSTKE